MCSDDENLERRLPMTNEQQLKTMALRQQGYGYIRISQQLGISDNTVRSFCRRNELVKSTKAAGFTCKQCEKQIKPISGRKPKKFCSDSCRVSWWNSHLECVNRKAIYPFNCQHCGKSFSAYGNRNRKYCSHFCYVADRFDKGNTLDG
jgi:hypothetical protein